MQVLRGIIEGISLTLALQNTHHSFTLFSSSSFPFFLTREGTAITLFAVGLILELGSETQRSMKKRKENRNKRNEKNENANKNEKKTKKRKKEKRKEI